MFTGCPFQGVINNTLAGSNRGIAFWAEPQGSDNVAVVSQSSDYQPGDSFPSGATVVTYNFTDAAGFVAKCSFSVIILGEVYISVTAPTVAEMAE